MLGPAGDAEDVRDRRNGRTGGEAEAAARCSALPAWSWRSAAGPAVLGAVAGAAIGNVFGIVAAVVVAVLTATAVVLYRHRNDTEGC